MKKLDESRFEGLYRRLNRREFVHPDPLEFLYEYDNLVDQEIVGLVASALAYGNVASILKSVSSLLKILGPEPSCFLSAHSHKTLRQVLKGFVHRFADSEKNGRIPDRRAQGDGGIRLFGRMLHARPGKRGRHDFFRSVLFGGDRRKILSRMSGAFGAHAAQKVRLQKIQFVFQVDGP